MTLELSTEQVWEAVESESFSVIGMVSAENQTHNIGGDRLWAVYK